MSVKLSLINLPTEYNVNETNLKIVYQKNRRSNGKIKVIIVAERGIKQNSDCFKKVIYVLVNPNIKFS